MSAPMTLVMISAFRYPALRSFEFNRDTNILSLT